MEMPLTEPDGAIARKVGDTPFQFEKVLFLFYVARLRSSSKLQLTIDGRPGLRVKEVIQEDIVSHERTKDCAERRTGKEEVVQRRVGNVWHPQRSLPRIVVLVLDLKCRYRTL